MFQVTDFAEVKEVEGNFALAVANSSQAGYFEAVKIEVKARVADGVGKIIGGPR